MDFTYAGIMLLAIVTGVAISRVTQSRLSLSGIEKLGIGIGAFCGAMIAAKLPFVIADPEGMHSGAAWFSDGKTIMCGLVGGYLGVEVAKWSLEIKTKTGDSFAVPVASAVAVGRLACFHAGCCFGTVTSLPWGVRFPLTAGPLPRHPTQLYEVAFHAAAAGVLWWLWRRQRFPGQLFKLYIIAYLVYRFASEFVRPEPLLWLGLSVYQWLAMALLPVFVLLWLRDARLLARSAMPPADVAARVP